MSRLRDLGVSLAIDDFGTGYSSLARLGHLPVDQVKIDQSFVGSPSTGPATASERIVDAVTGHRRRARASSTTAEGVETQRPSSTTCGGCHCDFGQGYLFAKPLPFDEFARLLASDPRW
jgi:EAL domain-containing protein (putative c-di-GMP-specific phosphodiesterase class I)